MTHRSSCHGRKSMATRPWSDPRLSPMDDMGKIGFVGFVATVGEQGENGHRLPIDGKHPGAALRSLAKGTGQILGIPLSGSLPTTRGEREEPPLYRPIYGLPRRTGGPQNFVLRPPPKGAGQNSSPADGCIVPLICVNNTHSRAPALSPRVREESRREGFPCSFNF